MRKFGAGAFCFAILLAACTSNTGTPSTGSALPLTHQSEMMHPRDVLASNGSTITVTGPVENVGKNQFEIDEGSGGGNVEVTTSSSTSFAGIKPVAGENVMVTGNGSFGSTIVATSVAQQIVLPAGTLALTGPVTRAYSGGFTFDPPGYGYTHVTTSSQTPIQGGTPAAGEYAQTVGPGTSSITATYVSLWPNSPASVTASGSIVAASRVGFTLDVSSSYPAVPVVLASSTKTSSWPMTVGGRVTVTGTGALSRSVFASSVVAVSPSPGPTPKPVVLSPGGVVGEDGMFDPADGDTPSGGTGQTVDSIPCAPSMSENSYHVHAFLGLFVNGTEYAVPDQIGLWQPGPIQNGTTNTAQCYYYIHFHDATGMIHIESPSTAPLSSSVYTLGNVLDVWGESVSATSFGPFSGQVRVFYDKLPLKAMTANTYTEYAGNPTALPLYSHEAIWIEVGPAFVLPPNIPAVEFYTEY
ncbi:MAG: hypothetical protein JO199_06905 [Candidatus Eremiobacteraeota bacterium]|nr:hypothetical protein [Candidatus Eremiobacteraeota bacterium]